MQRPKQSVVKKPDPREIATPFTTLKVRNDDALTINPSLPLKRTKP